MPDPAQQLQRLHEAGFQFQTFARFPNAVGVFRGDCMVLLAPSPEGLTFVGTPGWRMGDVMGVLTTFQGRQVFQAKADILEATPERLEELSEFRKKVEEILRAS